MRTSLLLLSLTAAVVAAGRPAADDQAVADEAVLRKAGLGTDAAAALAYFRQRTPDAATRGRIAGLIVQLGSDSFATRQQASAELCVSGLAAVRQLRVAANDPDPEVAARAERCLQHLEKVPSTIVERAAAHVLARLRPDGAADALLAFLPEADDERVTDEMIAALIAVAVRDGQPDAPLLAALHDKEPARRAAAAEALVRSGNTDARTAARALLQDPDPNVRLRAALAFVTVAQEKAAIPVLIDLLAELPQPRAWRAQDLLCRLAGESAPEGSLASAADRERYRTAWKEWWSAHAGGADLGRVAATPVLLGQTIVLMLEPRSSTGRVVCIGPDGEQRWSVGGLRNPCAFQFLPPDHVLVAEVSAPQVAEYTLQGDRVWRHEALMPIGCRRLPDGSFFIATRNSLLVVEKSGHLKFAHRRTVSEICAAAPLPDGRFVALTARGQCQFIDAEGQVKKSFPVGSVRYPADVEVLSNGRLLLTQTDGVAEFEPDGQQVWRVECPRPTSAQRLPNGNTLLTRQEGPNHSVVVEVDRKGEVVWQYKPTDEALPLRAIRR